MKDGIQIKNDKYLMTVKFRDKDRREARATRLIIWPKGETILDNLENRYSRPYQLYKEEIVPTVLDLLNLPRNTPIKWRQKGGCPCGCSPCFIVEPNEWHEPTSGKNVHVDVESL